MIEFQRALKHWRTVRPRDEVRFVDTRTQLHWAAQIVAAAPNTLLPRRDDDSQSAMHWLEETSTLAGQPLPTGGRRAGLSFSEPALQLLTPDGIATASYLLAGRTLTDGLEWLSQTLAAHHLALPAGGLQLRELELPDHDVASGGHFQPDGGMLAVLADAYTNGARFLGAVAAGTSVTSPPLCWPHHFDLGMVFSPGRHPDRSVGSGLSPGDRYYPEPYWYVSAYPQPTGRELPPLAGGHWHRDEWTGATLTTPEILEGDEDGQARLVATFLDSALNASRELLE